MLSIRIYILYKYSHCMGFFIFFWKFMGYIINENHLYMVV